jgi:hypothetical protein
MDDLRPMPAMPEMPQELSRESNYKASKQELLSRWEITIQFMSRGCVIRVGCKTIPFSTTEEAIAELQRYFNNPYEVEQEWRKLLD